jgi:hypothetical protein
LEERKCCDEINVLEKKGNSVIKGRGKMMERKNK